MCPAGTFMALRWCLTSKIRRFDALWLDASSTPPERVEQHASRPAISRGTHARTRVYTDVGEIHSTYPRIGTRVTRAAAVRLPRKFEEFDLASLR